MDFLERKEKWVKLDYLELADCPEMLEALHGLDYQEMSAIQDPMDLSVFLGLMERLV